MKNKNESKVEWQCNVSMTKYGRHESDGLWSIRWMKWTMVIEMNEMDYGRWSEWDRLCEHSKDGLMIMGTNCLVFKILTKSLGQKGHCHKEKKTNHDRTMS